MSCAFVKWERAAAAVSISPPSCFTVSGRYGTENMAIIHSAYASVLVFVSWAFSLPLGVCLYLCLCRSKIYADFTILRYRVTFVLGMAGRQWPRDAVEWTCTSTLRKVVNGRGTKSVMLEVLRSESCSASTCKERQKEYITTSYKDFLIKTPRISTSGVGIAVWPINFASLSVYCSRRKRCRALSQVMKTVCYLCVNSYVCK